MDWNNLPREIVPCALCGSEELEPLKLVRSWPVVRCRVCGLVYLRERPREDALEKVYSTEYYDGGDVGYHGYVETFVEHRDLFRKIFSRRSRDLRRHVGERAESLLEIGCAHGFLLDHLRSDGWSVSGYEVSHLSGEYARRELDLDVRIAPSLEQAGFDTGRFDVVLMLDVLEHLHRPFDVLRETARLLRPRGTLVVQCPYELYHWEEALEAVLRGTRAGRIEPDAVPAHLYFFQPRTLDEFMRKGGFMISARQSGNYGRVRRRVEPPAICIGSPAERLFRLIYFGMGLQRLLYLAARLMGQGNGLIRYATPVRRGFD
jgi:2-polyprenyl-3-methyl-5-hydroxy-6-metoxy-1,4-benzoquinol methylase